MLSWSGRWWWDGPDEWFPPFVGFGIVLVGLVGFEVWALAHRNDDR